MTNQINETDKNKQRLLTGDTPTGHLHLGHYVGSLENRVKLQDKYDCYFIIANVHAFTTHGKQPDIIRDSIINITIDYLAAGIDPKVSTIFLQSEIPAIAELTFLFSMLVTLPRIMRNPTVKNEIRDKELHDNYPFGFMLYPIGQVADILAFRPSLVPVGEDQLPHLELTCEIAKRFNNTYSDILPIIKPLVGRVKRLVGIGPPDGQGRLLKMSKSLNNAIYLQDDADTVHKKVMQMYTDPNRLKVTDPGNTEENPLWIFHDTFNPDKNWVADKKLAYQAGKVSDVDCKKVLIDVLNDFLDPMRARRQIYAGQEDEIIQLIKSGCEKANAIAEETLYLVKDALKQNFFARELALKL